MKYLFYFGHPAQYLFFRETLRRLSKKNINQITIIIKTKDVLEDLIRNDGFKYINILTKQRGKSKLAIILSFVKRNLLILPIILKKKPDILIGTDATIAQLGNLLKIDRITVIEDDYHVIENLAKLTYPYTQTILCPEICQVGPWTEKKIGYKGYMKLAYLHPSIFTSDIHVSHKYKLPNKYVLIRLAQLTAHHDFGIRGINFDLVANIIALIEANGIEVRLSAEATTENRFDKYLLKIDANDMHHVLSQATLLISDSQSMSVEAAMLGIPSIRYSDFVGKISVLEELEHVYKLTYGIPVGNEEQLIVRLTNLLQQSNLKTIFQKRRQEMIQDKINVTEFLIWFLEHYPRSLEQMKADSDYQIRFK